MKPNQDLSSKQRVQTSRSARRGAAGLAALLTGLLGLAGPGPAQAQPGMAHLPAPVAEALQRAHLPADALAAVVMPASGGWFNRPAWQHQADRPMQPASTMKLVTSIVALERLGPNLRGYTELWSAAPVVGDVLQGDLVIRGGADPELGWPQLNALLAELRWQGIREIAGDIVLDRTLFNPARPDIGPPPFDEQPEFAYNMVPDALQLGGNMVGLELRADRTSVQARPLPPLPGLVIDASALKFTERACRDWDDDWQSPPQLLPEPAGADGQPVLRVLLQGGFPRDCIVRTELQLIDRNALAERLLRALWQGQGGAWRGVVREGERGLLPLAKPLPPPLVNLQRPAVDGQAAANPDPVAAAPALAASGAAPAASANAPAGSAAGPTAAAPRLLARRVSRPWGELLRTLNKQSDNMLTRLLYLQLGVNAMAAEPGTPTATLAAREVQRWMEERRIPTAGLVLDNGSGLSRSERITPRALALTLRAAQQTRWASELMMSMPLVGVDGTMRNRLRASPAGGWARMKTGTLRNTTALAGYVPDPQGRLWIVASMVNHDRAAEGRAALDALVDWVASGGLRAERAGSARLPP